VWVGVRAQQLRDVDGVSADLPDQVAELGRGRHHRGPAASGGAGRAGAPAEHQCGGRNRDGHDAAHLSTRPILIFHEIKSYHA
jgi:hypothetical protein